MSRAYARFRLPDGSTVDLCPGDLIGRLWSAALRLDDARISEAHALLSLRGGKLKLLNLRGGMLQLNRAQYSEIELKPGMEIYMAEGLPVVVQAVELPDTVLAMSGLTPSPLQLEAAVYSVLTAPRPQMVPTYIAEAPAHLWSTGEAWKIRIGGGEPQIVEPGGRWEIGPIALVAVELPLQQIGLNPTVADRPKLHPPMKILARYDTVQIHRVGLPVVVISGIPARLLSELVIVGGSASWEALARELYPDEEDRDVLKIRWHRQLHALRDRFLRPHQIRPDLVQSTGTGIVELVLQEGDEVIDEC